jgi:predicted nucleotidyltransferase
MITQDLINQVIEKIAETFNPEKIILIGSYAYGNPQKGSDLDLVVVKDSNLPRHKRSREIRQLFYGWGIPMDIFVYTPEEIDYWKDVKCSFIRTIVTKGKVVYDRQKNTTCS